MFLLPHIKHNIVYLAGTRVLVYGMLSREYYPYDRYILYTAKYHHGQGLLTRKFISTLRGFIMIPPSIKFLGDR